MSLVTYLFLALVVGLVAAFIAKKQGRSAMRWFLAGFLFNALAIGVVVTLKNKHNPQGRWS